MRDQDRERFAHVMIGTAELYGKAMSDALLEIYWRALGQYEISDIEYALSRHALNPDGGQFMPKPADVVRYVDGGGTGKSAMAWTRVVKAIREVGGWRSVTFDDPAIQAVISDMGGWLQLCDVLKDPTAHNSNFPFVQKDFERRYKDYLERGKVESYPNVLIGRADAGNSVNGHPIEPPKLIGDESKAQLVYDSGQKLLTEFKHEPDVRDVTETDTGSERKIAKSA